MSDLSNWIATGFLDYVTTTIEPTTEAVYFAARNIAYASEWVVDEDAVPEKPWSFWHAWYAGTIEGLRLRDEDFRVCAESRVTYTLGYLGAARERRANTRVREALERLGGAGWLAAGKLEQNGRYRALSVGAFDRATAWGSEP